VSEGMEDLGVRIGSYIQGHHFLQCVTGEGQVGVPSHTQKGLGDT